MALTSHEYKVLDYLMHRPGAVVSRTELTEHIYAQDFDRDSNTIEVFVGRLRKKLPPDADRDRARAGLPAGAAAMNTLAPASLRVRLLLGTLVALALALLLAGVVLGGLFRDHVMRQFETTLTQQLDQLTARLEFDADGQPQIDPQALSDPRWQRPFSGLYWQLDRVSTDGQSRSGVLRSRSLWDTQSHAARRRDGRWRRPCARRAGPARMRRC